MHTIHKKMYAYIEGSPQLDWPLMTSATVALQQFSRGRSRSWWHLTIIWLNDWRRKNEQNRWLYLPLSGFLTRNGMSIEGRQCYSKRRLNSITWTVILISHFSLSLTSPTDSIAIRWSLNGGSESQFRRKKTSWDLIGNRSRNGNSIMPSKRKTNLRDILIHYQRITSFYQFHSSCN